MTYTAIATLLVLEDNLSRVNKQAIVCRMKELQLDTGRYVSGDWIEVSIVVRISIHSRFRFSFAAVYGSESDMRFVYCCAAICHMLNDWSAIDIEKTVQFISQSLVS